MNEKARRREGRDYDPYNMADAAGPEYNRMQRRTRWQAVLKQARNAFPQERGVSYVPRYR